VVALAWLIAGFAGAARELRKARARGLRAETPSAAPEVRKFLAPPGQVLRDPRRADVRRDGPERCSRTR
jgi:ribosomal protein S9